MSRLPPNILDTSGCLKDSKCLCLAIQIILTVTSAGPVRPQYLGDNNSLQHHFSSKAIVNLYYLNVYNMYISIPDWTLINLSVQSGMYYFPVYLCKLLKYRQFSLEKNQHKIDHTQKVVLLGRLLKLWIFDLLMVAVPWMTFKNLWFY